MATEWVKMEVSLASNPRVLGIARACKLDVFGVVGRLHTFWSWVDQQSEDGFLPHVTAKDVDRLVGKRGFAKALEAVKPRPWATFENDGLVIPNFEIHNGRSGKGRAVDNKKKQRQRAADRGKPRKKCPDAVPESVPMPSGQKGGPEQHQEQEQEALPTVALSAGGKKAFQNCPGGNAAESSVIPTEGVELDRETVRNSHGGGEPVAPGIDSQTWAALPDSLRQAAFAEVWADWRLHWSETFGRGRAMPQATEQSQLRTLATVGPDEAAKWVENAIDRGLRTPAEPFQNCLRPSASQGGGRAEPSKIPTEGVDRERLEALANACGGTLSGPLAPTASGLREMQVALAEILAASPDVPPEEITARAAQYRRKFAGVAVTARGLAKHWGTLAGSVVRVELPRAQEPEPERWRDYLSEHLPECAFAPGQSREAKKWADIDHDGQRWIIEGMEDHRREAVA